MPLSTVTPPTGTVIDVAEARLHVRQDITEEDPRLRRAILGCTAWAEGETNSSFMARRLLLTLDAFPGPTLMGVPAGISYSLPESAVLLENGPVLAVISIKYLDTNGTLQTLPTTEYQVDLNSLPCRITPKFGKIWPVTLPQIGAVQILFDAGMAAPVVADISADTIAVKGVWEPYLVGDALRLSNSGGALPAPLQELTDYFVQSIPSAGVYKLSLTAGGAAIDIADVGTGTHYVGVVPSNVIEWLLYRVGTAFEHREAEVAMERGTLVSLPFIDRLLDASSVPLY